MGLKQFSSGARPEVRRGWYADAGKRELPAPLRNRFTEIWVAEPSERSDLLMLAAAYLAGAAPKPPLDAVVDFYCAAKAEAVRFASQTPAYRPMHQCHICSHILISFGARTDEGRRSPWNVHILFRHCMDCLLG